MSVKAGQGNIELIVPAEDRMMMCVRLTTSGALAHVPLPLDALDDVRLAVEEACNCLIHFAGCAKLHLRYALGDDMVSVSVNAEGPGKGRQNPSEDELYTIRCILLSMVDEVKLSGSCDGLASILLTKRL